MQLNKIATDRLKLWRYVKQRRFSFILLFVSALFTIWMLFPDDTSDENQRKALIAYGWIPSKLPMDLILESSRFYECSSGDHGFEIYVSSNRTAYSPTPFPEGQMDCTPVEKPSFIQEIL